MRIHFKKARLLESRTAICAVVLIAAVITVVAQVLSGQDARSQEPRGDGAAEVRIAAQRLEDGEVRFGLRVRDGSGGWVEPVTPRAHRFDPATASIGRWLVSSPLTLEVDGAGRGRLARSDQFEPSTGGEVELVSGVEGWAGDSHYSAYHSEDGGLVTSVSMYSTSVGTPDGELRTTISCRDGETSVSIGGLPSHPSNGALTQQISVAWSVDNGTRHREHRALTSGANGPELVESTESQLARALLGGGSQLALSIGTTPELAANVDLDALRALPVYDNLRYCAAEAVQSGRTELRIRAQVRADERIEFAVQQRIGGGWSESIRPRARVIPAFGEATNWLSSTPVSVRVELDHSQAVIRPELALRRIPEPITPVLRGGYRTNAIIYQAFTQDVQGTYPTKLSSVVAAVSEQGLQLEVGCLGDERRVALGVAPADATGELSLAFDDVQLIANWTVRRGEGSVSLEPTDVDRTIQRLRQAQSLSVVLGSGDADPSTFDLVELFRTPIQANIDQCGNYAAPQWQPVITSLFVNNELDEYYRVSYSVGSNPQRLSQVRVAAVEGTPAAGTDRLDLVMNCASGSVGFTIWGLPNVGQPDSIRLQVDDGEWLSVPAVVMVHEDGSSFVAFNSDLSHLKQGRTLQYEIGLEEPARGAFDLTNLLGTPIQVNFDNCGRDFWQQARTFVPLVIAQQSSRSLSYLGQLNDDGTVTTVVRLSASDTTGNDGVSTIQSSCIVSDAFQMNVGVPFAVEPGDVSVSLTIDDRPADISTWIATTLGTRGELHPPSNARLMAELRRASVVVVEAPELFAGPITFHVSGMFDTPVQGNLDECGYYKPGELRRLPLPLNIHEVQRTHDADRDLRIVKFWERTPGMVTPSTGTIEQHRGETGMVIGLSVFCGGFGARLSVYGAATGAFTGDHVQVEWSTDGTTTQRETWNVRLSGGSNSVSPPQASAIIAQWRHAAQLELRLSGASSAVHRFDLEGMFDIPVIETMDDCLATPTPSQSPPVTGIPTTVQGVLSYHADPLDGSSWLSSYILLLDSGEAPAEPGELDTRSSLFIACTVDGIGLWLTRVGAAESASIYGDTVDVTWTIDGRTRTEVWDAWTQTFDYAIAARDHRAMYEALRGARALTIRIESEPPISKNYELARNSFWGTPVQPNLDACGDEPGP